MGGGEQPEEVDVLTGARRISKCHIGAEQKRECSQTGWIRRKFWVPGKHGVFWERKQHQ